MTSGGSTSGQRRPTGGSGERNLSDGIAPGCPVACPQSGPSGSFNPRATEGRDQLSINLPAGELPRPRRVLRRPLRVRGTVSAGCFRLPLRPSSIRSAGGDPRLATGARRRSGRVNPRRTLSLSGARPLRSRTRALAPSGGQDPLGPPFQVGPRRRMAVDTAAIRGSPGRRRRSAATARTTSSMGWAVTRPLSPHTGTVQATRQVSPKATSEPGESPGAVSFRSPTSRSVTARASNPGVTGQGRPSAGSGRGQRSSGFPPRGHGVRHRFPGTGSAGPRPVARSRRIVVWIYQTRLSRNRIKP